MLSLRALTIPFGLALSGCCLFPAPQVEDPAPVAPAVAPTPVASDGPFVYGEARRQRMAAPARFSAPWPGDLATLTGTWPESGPPREQALPRLCAGDAAAMRAWIDAAERASHGASRDEVLRAFDGMIEYCEEPAMCARGRETIEGGATGIARDVALLALAKCGRPEDAALADVESAPAVARIRWLDAFGTRHRDRPSATADRVAAARASIALAREGDYEAESRARHAIFAIARLPGGTEALRGLAPSLDGRPRALLDEVLASEYLPSPDEAPDATDVAALSPAERARLANEHETCARGGGYEGRRCLDELAVLDRPRAVALARELGDDEAMAETIAILSRFPEEGALLARLRELGLVGEDCASRAIDPVGVLLECARARQFDPETGTFPVHHDGLMAELALLAPGAIDDVAFEEIAPRDEGGAPADVIVANGVAIEQGSPEGAYALRAYSRGERFEVSAQMLDDWYDLEAALGLLNAVARARGSDARWLVIEPTGGNDATILAGPERGLRTAIEEHLIAPVSTSASEDARAAEERLIQQLIESGQLGR